MTWGQQRGTAGGRASGHLHPSRFTRSSVTSLCAFASSTRCEISRRHRLGSLQISDSVGLNAGASDRQPHPHSLRLGREKRFKCNRTRMRDFWLGRLAARQRPGAVHSKRRELTCLTVSRRNLVKQLDEVRLPGMRSTSRKRAPELPSARMRDRFGEIKLMREAV